MRDRADNQSCANEEPANSAQEARNFKRLSCCPLLTVCYNDAAGDQDAQGDQEAGKSCIIGQFKERRKRLLQFSRKVSAATVNADG